MNKSESIKELALALAKAQAEMGAAKKGKDNPFFKSKYADLAEVVAAVKEPFANHGLSYVQFPIEEGGRIGVETILMHESGEYLSNHFTVHLSKQDAQGAGSAITYCRRYALQAIAGIPAEDDDGNAASQGNAQSSKSDDNKPWYGEDDYERDIDAMTNAVKQGSMTIPQVINQLRQNYKVSRDMASSIENVINGRLGE